MKWVNRGCWAAAWCFATLYRETKEWPRAAEAYESLERLGFATPNDIFWMGFALHSNGDLRRALETYNRCFSDDMGVATLHNMGLVLASGEMARPLDAADCFRRVLRLQRDYGPSKAALERIRAPLLELEAAIRPRAREILPRKDWFRFYVNPFVALQFEGDDYPDDGEQIDVKVVQRKRKALLQELELNDGKVSWLEDHAMDRSRALALEDELLNETTRSFHTLIQWEDELHDFMTRGDVALFLYSQRTFPFEALEALEGTTGFQDFASSAFARQYDLVLTRAIDNGWTDVVKAMCSGRRWVSPKDDFACFEGASKRLKALIQRIEALASNGRRVEPKLIDGEISAPTLLAVLNHLPHSLNQERSELVEAIRSTAIEANNKHNDPVTALLVLSMCDRLRFKDTVLDERLKDDKKKVQEILDERNAHTFSATISGVPVAISWADIRVGEKILPLTEVDAVRCGAETKAAEGVAVEKLFHLNFRRQREWLNIGWTWSKNRRARRRSLANPMREPASQPMVDELSPAEQDAAFSKMIDAVINYVVPLLGVGIVKQLREGESVMIGPCSLSRTGLAFQSGYFFKRARFLPWEDCNARLANGQVIVESKANKRTWIGASLGDTDNAILLPFLCAAMRAFEG